MRVRWVPISDEDAPTTAELTAGDDLADVVFGWNDDYLFNRHALEDAIDSGNAEVWVIRDGRLDEVLPLTRGQ